MSVTQGQTKNDSKIIIRTDTAGIIQRITTLFYSEGYAIDKRDFGFLQTDEKAIQGCGIKVRAFLSGDSLILTGLVADNVSFSWGGAKMERVFYPVRCAGMKGSTLRFAWAELDRIAKLIGGTLTYSK